MDYSIRDYEAYLWEHYQASGIDSSLFMKLVEEVGEVAAILNKRDGRKESCGEDFKQQLSAELADVVHYAAAIAALNQIDLSDAILEKDREAAARYRHKRNLEAFLLEKPTHN